MITYDAEFTTHSPQFTRFYRYLMNFSKIRPLFALLAVFGLLTVLFAPSLFQGKILAPLDILTTMMSPWNANNKEAKPQNHFVTDAVTQYIPYRLLVERAFKEDGFIGWNPYEMGGYSMSANTMATPGSWSLQLHRIMSFKNAWNVGIYLEFLIAGLGMLVFLRNRKLAWLPCVIGSIAYMLNSQFIIWVNHRWALGSFCWMPWVMWSASGFTCSKTIALKHCFVPIFLALALLGGSLQHMAFVFLGCACLYLGAQHNRNNLNFSKNLLLFWALSFVLACGIAGFSLVPQIQGYITNNELGHIRGAIGYQHGLIQPILNMFLIPLQFWPWLVGEANTLDGFKLLKCSYMDIAYFGTIPTFLAIMGLFLSQMPKQAKWLILVGLVIPLTPLVGPLYHRVQLLFILGGAWMTAEVLSYYTKNCFPRIVKLMALATVAVGLMLTVVTIIPEKNRAAIEQKVIEKAIKAAENSQFNTDREWIVARARLWVGRFSLENSKTQLTYSLLVAGVFSIWLLWGKFTTESKLRLRSIALICILICTIVELSIMFNSWCTFSLMDDFYPENQSISKIKNVVGSDRVSLNSVGARLCDSFAAPNSLVAYGIRTADAYESIHYTRIGSMIESLTPEEKLLISNVNAVVEDDRETVDDSKEFTILTPQHRLKMIHAPIAHIVAGADAFSINKASMITTLKNAQEILPDVMTMSRITFKVPGSTNWIRVAENWHPGWLWRVKGEKWAKTRKGADGATWIHLTDSNEKIIEMIFTPCNLKVKYVSITALVVVILTILWFLSKNFFLRKEAVK